RRVASTPSCRPLLFSYTTLFRAVHQLHRDQWKLVSGPFPSRLGCFLESRVPPAVYRDSRYVTVSKSTRDELAGLWVDPERVDLVYSGNDRPEDLDRYTALPRTDTPSMLFLGRLVPHQHLEQAIDVLATRSRTH